MSDIPINDLTARARTRIARIAQVAALPPQPRRHDGDYWALTRKRDSAYYTGRHGATIGWPAMAMSPMVIGIQATANATTTITRTVGFAYRISEIEFIWNAGIGETLAADISISGYGSVWQRVTNTPQLTLPAGSVTAQPTRLNINPHILIHVPGTTITITIVSSGVGTDAYGHVVITPTEP